jgi:hypothetical protein
VTTSQDRLDKSKQFQSVQVRIGIDVGSGDASVNNGSALAPFVLKAHERGSLHFMCGSCVTASRKCFKPATRGQRATSATFRPWCAKNAICDACLQAAAAAEQHQGRRRCGLQGLNIGSRAMPAGQSLAWLVFWSNHQFNTLL